APEYLGPTSEVSLITEGGRRFAEVGGAMREAVIVGANDIGSMIVPGPEGVYLVGTGSVGVAQTFITLGLIYFVVMLIAAFSYRLPAPGWQPPGWTPPDAEHRRKRMIGTNDVHVDQALKTPQFYQLWIVLCFNVTAGIGVLSVARTMMSEIFGTTLPGIVDGAFAATYVAMISVFNMIGRFVWASTSDFIGRRNTYWIFFALGIVLYLSIPYAAGQVSVQPATIWLIYFYAATMIIFTMYGGGFATIPAYLADIFGTEHVGAIHGRLLTAWSVAGVLGPVAINSLRDNEIARAIDRLVAQIDPAQFAATFGAGVDQLDTLVAAQTVTIPKLMEIVPPGTPDPTSSLYNVTMYLMAALLAIALVANALMRPVHPKHHIEAT
ncbi:MAG: MFS transporter, partial [Gammaproteobacteria bacterium]